MTESHISLRKSILTFRVVKDVKSELSVRVAYTEAVGRMLAIGSDLQTQDVASALLA